MGWRTQLLRRENKWQQARYFYLHSPVAWLAHPSVISNSLPQASVLHPHIEIDFHFKPSVPQ
jgi:hypothetical protein